MTIKEKYDSLVASRQSAIDLTNQLTTEKKALLTAYDLKCVEFNSANDAMQKINGGIAALYPFVTTGNVGRSG